MVMLHLVARMMINVVKPSVINTRGMLSRRINCLPPQPEYRTCKNCDSTDADGNPPSWVL